MRNLVEPMARKLLRKPDVLGVPAVGLALLLLVVVAVFLFTGTSWAGNVVALGLGLMGYTGLRIFNRWASPGWEEGLRFWFESKIRRTVAPGHLEQGPKWTLSSLDTLADIDAITTKEQLLEQLRALSPEEKKVFLLSATDQGAKLHEVTAKGDFCTCALHSVYNSTDGIFGEHETAFSLVQLPVVTDPYWISATLERLPRPFRLLVTLEGLDQGRLVSRLERARRGNFQGQADLADIESEVSFEDAELVLQGLRRGTDLGLRLSVLLVAPQPLNLDPAYWLKEKDLKLPLWSALGIRKRMHRAHTIRGVTASDLIPLVLDPEEEGAAVLRTPRGYPLYVSPQDPRLEALHWLVVGASGSGKSFFTGLVLKRLLDAGTPMSVLVLDHNRSFRRWIAQAGGAYAEPESLKAADSAAVAQFDEWNRSGSVCGIELSEIDAGERKAAVHSLLSRIETFLRFRDSDHPFYLVLDECWNFLRDEPTLVQRAFREFRKLNGAVIAVTQSLQDFLLDPSGQSILQNSPIRIILRQGEDVTRYQSSLGLTGLEMSRVVRLRQERGVFSECLLKTPFLSRVGRLYPTEEEHALFRTDNLRSEYVMRIRLERREREAL